MSENYPSLNPDSSSGNSDSSPPKRTVSGSRIEGPKTTKRAESIKKVAGDEILTFGEGIKFKSLGESMKPASEQKAAQPELFKQQHTAEQSGKWQEVSADSLRAQADQSASEQLAQELRTRAARDTADQLAHHREKFEKEDSSEEDSEEKDDKPVVKVDKPTVKQVELSPQERIDFAKLIKREAPELIVETSGDNLGSDELPEGMFLADIGSPDTSRNTAETPQPTAEAGEWPTEQTAEAPVQTVDELDNPEAFDKWTQAEHPELRVPEMSAASDNDEAFNDIVQHSLGGKPPGEVIYQEQAPGQPPVAAGGGHNKPPNNPPRPTGGPGGGNQNGPNRGFGGNQNNPNQYHANVGNNAPNPNAIINPWVAAGGLLNPNVLAIPALMARQKIENFKHTAREIGLAGAVGVLGLGLAIERHRRKQLSKQVGEQGKQIAKTNEALHQEQSAHELSKQRLERDRVAAEQVARPNKLDVPSREAASVAAAETGYFAGPKANRFRPETAPITPIVRSTQASEQAPKINNEEMARYLQNNREAGRAIIRNPELKNNAEFAAAITALGAESVEASKANEKPVFNKEGTHEQLQSQYRDAGGVSRSTSGTDPIRGMGPAPLQPNYDNTSFQNTPQHVRSEPDMPQSMASKYAKPASAGVGVILLLAAILFFVLH